MAAVRDVDRQVEAAQVLGLLGPNGAGRTALLQTLDGLVPGGRALFTTLTVEENLQVAPKRGGPRPRDLLEILPSLGWRWRLPAGALSGGEQQMLTQARAHTAAQGPAGGPAQHGAGSSRRRDTHFGGSPDHTGVRRITQDHGSAVVLVEQHIDLVLEVAYFRTDKAALGAGWHRGPLGPTDLTNRPA